MKKIDAEFNKFIDFPTEDKMFVTSVSAKLFAEHMINIERNEFKKTMANAERYLKLCGYLISDRTDLDNKFVNCLSKHDFDCILDTI